MSNKELITNELDHIPEPLLQEVLDFVRSLRAKVAETTMETALASESSLRKDWLRPEEDAAWQNL